MQNISSTERSSAPQTATNASTNCCREECKIVSLSNRIDSTGINLMEQQLRFKGLFKGIKIHSTITVSLTGAVIAKRKYLNNRLHVRLHCLL